MHEIGILISLILLIYIAYRGYSVIVFAPVCACVAALIASYPLLPLYTEKFMPAAAGYVRNFFPIFVLGAIFGKLIEETGMAKSIAEKFSEVCGAQRALYAIVLSSAFLTYGGVSLFVTVFAVYPVAASLCKKADIPKRLIPGCIAFGSFTFAATFIPGSPQIQNIISTRYFHTTAYAGPVLGIVTAAFVFALGMAWLEYRRSSAQKLGEGYGTGHTNESEVVDNIPPPPFLLSIIPLLLVLVLNYVFTQMILGWDAKEYEPLFGKINMATVVGTWALVIALIIGNLLVIAMFGKRLGVENIKKCINGGAIGSLLAVLNTASEVGYGSIISQLPGFKTLSGAITSIRVGGTPLLSLGIAVSVLAGITGSGSGGLSIALEMLSAQYIEWANQLGMDVQLLHRIASMSCTGLDTLPHNGAVITLLAVTGLTHKQSYVDIGVCTVLITTVVAWGSAVVMSIA
ncbi:MAG: GntP family permease [Deltaproteobacteria bacterium]|jgi:H+/gluconate symporter-like permease|nr:GntP family permease [Deltaproteobacteria bacterium]